MLPLMGFLFAHSQARLAVLRRLVIFRRLRYGRRFRFGLRSMVRELFNRFGKGAVIEELNQGDHIATDTALAAVPELLIDVDSEPITAAAPWTSAAPVRLATELDAATLKLDLDPHAFGARDDVGRDGH
jgi:hypothetical protein